MVPIQPRRFNPSGFQSDSPNGIFPGKMPVKHSTKTYNVYVENHYDGSYRNWGGDAWAGYYPQQNNDSGGGFWDKFSEITSYAGAGIAGLGSLIGIFKKGD